MIAVSAVLLNIVTNIPWIIDFMVSLKYDTLKILHQYDMHHNDYGMLGMPKGAEPEVLYTLLNIVKQFNASIGL